MNVKRIADSLALALLIAGAAVSPAAQAKGCLKGAAVGGVAGHVAGHHGLLGAAAGCAIEHHREKVKDRQLPRENVKNQQQSKEQIPAKRAPTETPSSR